MDDQSELLDKLKIDRSQKQTDDSGKKWFLLSLLLFLFSGAFALYGFLGGGQQDAAPVRPAAETPKTVQKTVSGQDAPLAPASTPAADTSREILNASGYITARRMATVSAEITGLITDVYVEEGMTVEKGQILARLDATLAEVGLNAAKAQVRVTEAQLEGVRVSLAEAERVLKRVSSLNVSDFSSEANVTKARTDVENLKLSIKGQMAQLEVLKLDVQNRQERVNDYTIRAPFAGVVTVKNAQPGEIISPASAGGGFTRTGICTIVDMASLEIEVDVNEAFIGRVTAGQKVIATLDAYPRWDIDARVIAVIPTADRAKATVRVRIEILDKDPRILPDMGVKVAFLKE